MRRLPHTLALIITLLWAYEANSETLVLSSGRTIDGIILRTNGGDFLVLTDFGTLNFGQKNIKEIRGAGAETTSVSLTSRVPNLKTTLLTLIGQKWGSDVIQIPATVVDKGMFRNVPYLSFRCSEDYEVNIYGDLNDPAAIEAGVYRKLLNSEAAKSNCVAFISSLLQEKADRDIVQTLSRTKDFKTRNGLTFETTPPTDEDAYEGWWISVCSEDKLNKARASEKELNEISIAKTSNSSSDWSAAEMKLARPNRPELISFVTSSGTSVTDAEVVRVVDGSYLIWRKDASGGKVRLSELSPELQSRFGYDTNKANASYAAEDNKTTPAPQAQNPPTQIAAAPQQSSSSFATGTSFASSSASSGSSGGGRVYVHGYTRKDGTYVHSYYRSSPKRR